MSAETAPFADLPLGKHLVLDHHTVADTYRLRRRVHQPRKDPAEPVLVPEAVWEADSVVPVLVLRDEERARWRMWYEVHNPEREARRHALRPGLAGNIGEPQAGYLCYAESADGAAWERPVLGVCEDEAGPNNICFKGFSGAHGPGMLYQPDASADERFVMANLDWFSMGSGGVCFAFSPDGLHWAYKDEKPAIFGCSDTRNCLLYNAERGVYMIYLRAWHSAAVGWVGDWVGGPGVPRAPRLTPEEQANRDRMFKETGRPVGAKNARRRVSYAESADLAHWSEPQIILTPDELDPDDFYGLLPFPYADYFLGQLWVYDDNEQGTLEVELVFSRDGVHWTRLPERPRLIPLGEPGDPDGYMILPGQRAVVAGDSVYLYWSGCDMPHDAGGYRAVMYRGRLRMDGFVSLSADRRLGALITRPFTLESDRIEVNAAVHGGQIIAELVEPDPGEVRGRAVEGFTADEFDAFTGDSTAHRLSWGGRSDLSALRGRRLMLRMSMFHADLYSFTL